MPTHQRRSSRHTRLLAMAGAVAVAAAGSLGLAVSAGSDDTPAPPAKHVTTAPATPLPTVGTHWPTPPPASEQGTRPDGGPDEGTRGPAPETDNTACIDPETGGHGPQHC
jgi:hypothetical protein